MGGLLQREAVSTEKPVSTLPVFQGFQINSSQVLMTTVHCAYSAGTYLLVSLHLRFVCAPGLLRYANQTGKGGLASKCTPEPN